MALDGGYDVLIVDRMLPKRDGLSVISALRAKAIDTPVLILSALGQVDDRIKGLRAGGDDYLPKPYSFAELQARVEVLSRRNVGPAEETTYRVGDLELDVVGVGHDRLPPGADLLPPALEGAARMKAGDVRAGRPASLHPLHVEGLEGVVEAPVRGEDLLGDRLHQFILRLMSRAASSRSSTAAASGCPGWAARNAVARSSASA